MPCKTIYEVIRLSGNRDKRIANINSLTTARLASIVISIAQGIGGQKANPPDVDKLIPFPLDAEAAQNLDETNEVFKRLIKDRKLPIHVIASLKKVVG